MRFLIPKLTLGLYSMNDRWQWQNLLQNMMQCTMTKTSRASCVRSSSMWVSGVFKGAVNIPNFASYLFIKKKKKNIHLNTKFISQSRKKYLSTRAYLWFWNKLLKHVLLWSESGQIWRWCSCWCQEVAWAVTPPELWEPGLKPSNQNGALYLLKKHRGEKWDRQCMLYIHTTSVGE